MQRIREYREKAYISVKNCLKSLESKPVQFTTMKMVDEHQVSTNVGSL